MAIAVVVASTSSASAALPSGPSWAAEHCREVDATGLLDELGAHRGACVILSSNSAASPSANRTTAGFCAIEASQVILGVSSPGECQQLLDRAQRPFSAALVQTIDQRGPISSTGSAMRMGSVSETGSILGFDFTNYPPSLDIYMDSVLTSGKGDQLLIHYVMTLTDVDEPPNGVNFSVGGGYFIIDGSGRFAGAHGTGQLSGTCTSPIGDPHVYCTTELSGLIGY